MDVASLEKLEFLRDVVLDTTELVVCTILTSELDTMTVLASVGQLLLPLLSPALSSAKLSRCN